MSTYLTKIWNEETEKMNAFLDTLPKAPEPLPEMTEGERDWIQGLLDNA